MFNTIVPPNPASTAPPMVTATTSHETNTTTLSDKMPSATHIMRARPKRLISRGAMTAVSIAPTARPVPCRPEIARLVCSSSRSSVTDGVNEYRKYP